MVHLVAVYRLTGCPLVLGKTRPHPSEDIGFWHDRFGANNSVVVTNEHSISPWAQGAKAVLHNSCTTAVEANLYGVPTIAYTPGGEAHGYEVNLGNLSSHQSDDRNSIVGLLKSAAAGDLSALPASEKLKEYLMSPDGTCDRIASAITAHVEKSYREVGKNNLSIAKGWVRWLQVAADKRGLKIASNDVKYSNRKFPFTRSKEIINILDKISEARFPELKYKVVKIDTNLFYLAPQ